MENENRIGVMERLRAAGVWGEATEFKETTRQRLRSEGKSRADAKALAWSAMVEKFLPQADEEEDAGEQEAFPPSANHSASQPSETVVANVAAFPLVQSPEIDEAILEKFEGGSHSLVRDVLWVYERLEDRRAKPEDAPSLGAWSLLIWARGARNRFFEQLLPKALAKQSEAGDATGQFADDPDLGDLKKMLDDLTAGWEASLAKDVPGTVLRDVRSELGSWQERFPMELPADACKSLERRMAGLAGRCVKAALSKPEQFRVACSELSDVIEKAEETAGTVA